MPLLTTSLTLLPCRYDNCSNNNDHDSQSQSDNDTQGEKQTNKQQQNIKIADLGCGAGNLSIPLAWFLKQTKESDLGSDIENNINSDANHIDAQVVAVDINKRALNQLDKRAKDIGLDVQIVQEDLLNLIATTSTSQPSIDEKKHKQMPPPQTTTTTTTQTQTPTKKTYR